MHAVNLSASGSVAPDAAGAAPRNRAAALSDLEQRAVTALRARADDLTALLSRLVQFDTTNYIDHGDEAVMAPFIVDQYRQLGLAPKIYYPDDVPGLTKHEDYRAGRGTDSRPNVMAWKRGYAPPEQARRVMLAAHSDVMPAGDPALWTYPPFGGQVVEGRLYGRGACDDKFGIAAGIIALQALQDAGIELAADVCLTAYCDEEYGGGNGALAACVKTPCDVYANLDGGNYELWSCSIGGVVIECSVVAREPQDSAALVLTGMDQVRAALEPFVERRRAELHADPFYAGSDMERSVYRILECRAGHDGANLDRATMKFVFYTTAQQESIRAELAAIEAQLSASLNPMGMRFTGFTPASRFFHYLAAADDDPALAIMQKAAEDAAGRPVRRTGACLSDLSLFLKHGSRSSFNFGLLRDFKLPGGAHQTDEFADLTELMQVTEAILLFLIRWGGGRFIGSQ